MINIALSVASFVERHVRITGRALKGRAGGSTVTLEPQGMTVIVRACRSSQALRHRVVRALRSKHGTALRCDADIEATDIYEYCISQPGSVSVARLSAA